MTAAEPTAFERRASTRSRCTTHQTAAARQSMHCSITHDVAGAALAGRLAATAAEQLVDDALDQRLVHVRRIPDREDARALTGASHRPHPRR